MKPTLGQRLERLDRSSFVGRARELAAFEELLAEEPAANVLLVHGPGGVGKSTLLREAARRAAGRGWTIHWIEGRELAPVPDALESALGVARAEVRPLVVLDDYERCTALGSYLRRGVIPTLPAGALVVVCGRELPEPAWFSGGLERLVRDLPLGGLSDSEAHRLLAASGALDEPDAERVVTWAAGSPLALTLAADAAAAGATPSGDQGAQPSPDTVRALCRRLLDAELTDEHLDVLAVAAIARVTTRELLAEVLAHRDATDGYRWLSARSFTEPLGAGLALHELVRRPLASDLRRREPEREAELRRRVADHLYRRAARDELVLSIDLAHLIESPAIRWGYSWEGSGRYRIDSVREGDGETVASGLRRRGSGGWWTLLEPFFSSAPERVAIARDPDDEFAGYLVSVTPLNAPAFAHDDPLLGPRLEHAKRISPAGNAVLVHDAASWGNPAVQAMLGVAAMLRSGLRNPRYAYLPIDPGVPHAREFSAALGALRLPELDVEHAGVSLECHLLDYGPGGLLGAQRAVVYRELGLEPPAGRAVCLEELKRLLQGFSTPATLAASDLAEGETIMERAGSVRALIEGAVERAFGSSDAERLLRRVLERGYLDPATTHEAAAEELHLSRSAYFRRLRVATERLADDLARRGTTSVPG